MPGHSHDGLAATKLVPPTLPDRLVHRARLTDRLDASLAGHTSLVLASAPAGSGKSTLLASWLATRSGTAAWLQVEEDDSDPARFWTHLVAAVVTACPSSANSLAPLAGGREMNDTALVSAMVNEFAELTESLVLVIDDYHLISTAAVHKGVERLIDLCPPTATIVISTRIDPPFRLGRLRVRHQLMELRNADFRFEPEEAAGLLSHSGPHLDADIVEQLCDRTEGWAAGLVLAGLSLSGTDDVGQFIEAFHGDDQLVVDYMTDEFLAGLTDPQRRRLLETSVLEQFNGSLVDAVTGDSDGARWLHDTATTNQLMVSLDRTGSWYRYHHLFRDLLRLEAEQQLTPDQRNELHRRAASWFHDDGDLRRAVQHHLAAGDQRSAVRVMRKLGPQLIADGQIDTLRTLLEQLGEAAHGDPAVALTWAWCDYIAGHYGRAQEWIETTHRLAGPGFDQVPTAPLRMSLAIARGDVGTGLELAREMKDKNRFATHGSELAASAGGVFMWAGQAAAAREVLDVAMQRSAAESSRAIQALVRIYQAINDFDDQNDPSGAQRALDTAEELRIPDYYRMAPAYAIRSRVDSNSMSARADVERAVALARQTPGDLALAFTLTTCGDTLLDAGDATGSALLSEARKVVDRCPDPGIVGRHLARIESRHGLAAGTGSSDRLAARTIDSLVDQLTERELAVLRYLPTKLSQREIASELFVSPNTVKTHCAAVYRKLGVGDRKAAVQSARDVGLL